ncbi:MAG: hypothetical protein K0Q95_991 [Bacteroidota bacterium]|jgi:hypothetical protein|nr:hypothetical protein [Bacteroidota bacterium]
MKLSISITAGVIAGIILSATWYAMAKSMGFYEVKVYVYRNYLTFLLILIGVVSCILLTKRQNNGYLEFKEALKTGMLFSLVFAVIIACFNFLYYSVITPDTIDYFLSEAKNQMIADKIKEADFPKYLDRVRANYGSFRLIPPVLFWGLILSLITGALAKKKEPFVFGEN